MLTSNIKVFLEYFKLQQVELSTEAGIDPSHLSTIIKRGRASKMTLKRISRALSRISGISLADFDDGQALLKKDFKPIVERYHKEQSLHVRKSPASSDDSSDLNRWEARSITHQK